MGMEESKRKREDDNNKDSECCLTLDKDMALCLLMLQSVSQRAVP